MGKGAKASMTHAGVGGEVRLEMTRNKTTEERWGKQETKNLTRNLADNDKEIW